MTITSPDSSGSSSLHWGALLALTTVAIVGGVLIVYSHREPPRPTISLAPPADDSFLPRPESRVPRQPTLVELNRAGLYQVTRAVEHGTPIVKIKVVPDGDELIVDAATGRLLETRPSRPTAPPPMGKFAAPFIPSMG